jgi:DNA-binding LacI/PurR family transcriptional regulator
MGSLAATTLLERLAAGTDADIPEVLSVEPTLVVRNSTARVTEQK